MEIIIRMFNQPGSFNGKSCVSNRFIRTVVGFEMFGFKKQSVQTEARFYTDSMNSFSQLTDSLFLNQTDCPDHVKQMLRQS